MVEFTPFEKFMGMSKETMQIINECCIPIEQQTCDHVIGVVSYPNGVKMIFRKSTKGNILKRELFNYCTNCGARLETV